MKPKILFVMYMPPPVHGAAMVGQYIHDSKLINREFDCHYINHFHLLLHAKDDTVGNIVKRIASSYV